MGQKNTGRSSTTPGEDGGGGGSESKGGGGGGGGGGGPIKHKTVMRKELLANSSIGSLGEAMGKE